MSTKNPEIQTAIDEMNIARARELLRDALSEANGETYYLAARVAIDDEQRLGFLQKSVELDPFNEKAYKELQNLKLKDTPSTPPPAPPPAPAEAVVAAPVAAEPLQPKALTIQVKSSQNLLRLPWPTAAVRSNMSSGTQAMPLGRTESGNWINVLYVGSTGHEVLGWILTRQAGQARYGNQEVRLMDLPITNFEYNTKQDMIDLKRLLINFYQRKLLGAYLILVLIAGIYFYGIYDAMLSNFESGGDFTTYLVISGGLFVIFLLLAITSHSSATNEIKYHLGEGGLSHWNGTGFNKGRLDDLRRSKQSVTETMMEDQARIAVMQIAGNMASRYISNKQEITIKRR